ncbi:hypothetical protein [Streptomyces sp. NPDC048350]|uniref:hypothetical protein n=1 Tax=Streptomyces sp. NPDC048350 TaxID=3365538 RepID=UPI00371E51D0
MQAAGDGIRGRPRRPDRSAGLPGGDVDFPDVHPDQVAALARRRDPPALLDRHVPLGPDPAAIHLGVRRADFDQAMRLGWI